MTSSNTTSLEFPPLNESWVEISRLFTELSSKIESAHKAKVKACVLTKLSKETKDDDEDKAHILSELDKAQAEASSLLTEAASLLTEIHHGTSDAPSWM